MTNKTTKKEEPKEAPKDDTISVSKKLMEDMQNQVEELKKLRNIFFETADKRSMARYWARHGKDRKSIVKLRHIGGNVIVGWTDMPKNDVYKGDDRKWRELQRVKLLFEDGTSKEMSYSEFGRTYEYYECERIGVVTDEGGKSTSFKLKRLDNGEVYEIDVRFVN